MQAESQVAAQAFAIGLTSFIPLPFLDEWVRARLLRRSFASMASTEGVELSAETLKILSQDRQSFIGGCLIGLFWWPIRKFIRVVLYFLTIKEFLDWICEGVLRAEMIRHACRAGVLPKDPERVRRVMGRVMIAHPHSPVRRLLLFRKRPTMDLSKTSGMVRFVYRLVQLGGGAILMDAFERGLYDEE